MAPDDLQAVRQGPRPHRSDVRSAWIVSVQSLTWTLISGSSVVAVGLSGRSVVLVAFGAIGLVDAIGSAALAYHFRHGLRHEELSHRLERLAHRIVILGLLLVGFGAVVGGGVRLMNDQIRESSAIGTGLAALSLFVLAGLSKRKRSLAARVSSRALLGDSHLSAVGAMQAGVALAGSATTRLGWHWADPTAAIVLGSVAMAVSLQTWRAETGTRRLRSRSPFVRGAFGALSMIAVTDALFGEDLILIGFLIVGPACAAASIQPRATAAAGTSAVALAIGLGLPDHIWLTGEHLIWIATVALVAVVTTAVVVNVAPLLPAAKKRVIDRSPTARPGDPFADHGAC